MHGKNYNELHKNDNFLTLYTGQFINNSVYEEIIFI